MNVKKVGVLVGSLRKESFSKKLAQNVAMLFPEGYELEMVEIGNIPFYNQDFDDEDNLPAEIGEFRNKIAELDAFLLITPEYNRSVPAVLKNALDTASRPMTDNKWSGKPAAIISQSPGGLGGFGANQHLRQTLTCLNVPVLQQPEAYIGNVATLLNENGEITNEGTVEFLTKFVNKFVDLIEKY
ncbi:NADPH-dependent FMN reductase [Paucisalibacillus sp. EB02]|uniref:NADPH-dependent FMN reductase n=1 Tax=Paucisalibacillus sp. EB02 TaxID=1347087 RepID=UPI0005A5E113|nr:NAD(P)H-dependent oxidoreductase [Paucisalibacillus sp. EB02]